MSLPVPYYQDDAVVIYLGDCREILPEIDTGSVDLVLTDPPYGVGLTSKQHKWFHQNGDGYASVDDTEDAVLSIYVPIIHQSISQYGRVIVTPGTRCAWFYPRPDELGTIFNSSGTGRGRWGFNCNTPILYYGKDPHLGRKPNSWQQPANDFAEKWVDHPCPKPILMMRWLVNRGSLPDETILDPFMGSGTTLRAAKDLGRKAIGIEIEEKYCEIAAKRMSQTVMALEGTA